MEITQCVITLHAILGAVALISGAIPLFTLKGGIRHKSMGKIFFWTMSMSILLALVIAIFPDHVNYFLFAIGLFSLYLLLTGYLVVNQFHKKQFALGKALSTCMIIIGLAMLFLPLAFTGKINLILSIFGLAGVVLSMLDLRFFYSKNKEYKGMLQLHLSRIIGSYIAAWTAFIVVNEFISGLLGWLAPSLVGTAFIFYWIKKSNAKKVEEY